jgi:Zn-dependent peptidase ImmA (M78 family)
MNETNRGRFSLAHEMGHYVMHKDIVQTIQSIDDWKKKVLGDGAKRALLENEANDFAGCILMPKSALTKEYDQQMAKAEQEFKKLGLTLKDNTVVDSYIAVAIAKNFGVSQQAAEIRIYKAIKRK